MGYIIYTSVIILKYQFQILDVDCLNFSVFSFHDEIYHSWYISHCPCLTFILIPLFR